MPSRDNTNSPIATSDAEAIGLTPPSSSSQLPAKQLLRRASQHGLEAMDGRQIEQPGALGPSRWSIPGGEQQRFDRCFPSFRHQIIDYGDAPSTLAGAQQFSEEYFVRVFVQQPWSDVVEYHHELIVRPENRSCL